jgi:carbon-monoxide dehydrogenase medium subunit
MKPPVFDYVRPDTLEEALGALAAAGGEGKLLAGGQSLMPMLNFRLLRPSVLIDINRLPALAGIEARDGSIIVGALARHHQLETSPVVARDLPVLHEAMRHVAHLAIRNRGTIGGSLAHADPAAELPAMALLLDARIGVARAGARRVVAAREFFTGALATCLGEDEIVTDIAFDRPPEGHGWAFEELARRAGDFALAGVGVILVRSGETIVGARIALMGVHDTPLRAEAAEALLCARGLAALDDAVAAIRAACAPLSDLHASADYRRHLVGALARRSIETAWRRAGEARS